MTAKVKQSRWDEALVGEGICAALSMQWLQVKHGLTNKLAPITSLASTQRT
jgi:hypothetical protein